MTPGSHGRRWSIGGWLLVLCALLAQCCAGRDAHAQVGVGAVGGVSVDPQGMLRESSRVADKSRFPQTRDSVPAAPDDSALSLPSKLRMVSLRALEAEVFRRHTAGQPLPSAMVHLAGLQAVRYVLIDQARGEDEPGDVILAGPADGWKDLATGEIAGRQSSRPVLHLDDLIVALRFAFGENHGDAFAGCSIQPTAEGIKGSARFFRQLGGRIDRTRLKQTVSALEEAVGPQDILLYGVDGSSRMALVMVAADYRLKRIALGHDASPVRKVPSYLDLISNNGAAGAQAQHRWWFVGAFDAIHHSPDRTAFEFEGLGLQVRTAPQSAPPGDESQKATPAARKFAELFTKHLDRLSTQTPVFAELQNLVGLLVAAELVHQAVEPDEAEPDGATDDVTEDDRPGPWRPAHFLDPDGCPIAVYAVPRQTPSLANLRLVNGRTWLFSVSGGVELSPQTFARRDLFHAATPERFARPRALVRPTDPRAWWWDDLK